MSPEIFKNRVDRSFQQYSDGLITKMEFYVYLIIHLDKAIKQGKKSAEMDLETLKKHLR